MGNETELIKERLDVADVIGEYVPLKRVGGHYKGLCPFHQEKTPSFIVSPDKGIWHCFGCNKGGDVFSFVQEIEGIDFPQALKMLAERAGVELRRSRLSHPAEASRDKRQRLFALLATASKFYHTLLTKHEEGKKALEYLKERGVKDETMREFEIGYAPMRWDSLQQFLQKKGFTPEEMIQAGLVGQGQGGKSYDRFRGRIMFPVTDVQGRVVAFGGRITPWHATGEEGKYINSPETSLYEKRRVVFNLSRAKSALRHEEPGVVVEGYMDAVMLWQAGVKNVVASSGTAFTAEQIALLKRYTNTLHFAFDADSAGEGATTAATQAALDAGMRVATIMLPAGKDPADVAKEGEAAVQTVFGAPASLVSVLLGRLSREADPRKREEQLQSLLPFIRQVRNPVLQGEMVREAAETLSLPETQVIRLLGQARVEQKIQAEPVLAAGPVSGERELLGILILDGGARQELWAKLTPELFVDQAAQDLYNTMHTIFDQSMDLISLDEEGLAALMPPSLRSMTRVLAGLGAQRVEQAGGGARAEAEALLRNLQQRYLRLRLRHMQAELSQASPEEREQLLTQFQQVAEELAAVSSVQA